MTSTTLVEAVKNWQIYCSDCDFFIRYYKKKYSYVKRAMKMISQIPDTDSKETCKHILEIREFS